MSRLKERWEVFEEEQTQQQTQQQNVQQSAPEPYSQRNVKPSKIIREIKDKPVPKGVCKEVIWGTPVDWHDLEEFVVSISPLKFVNLLKLQKEQLRAYGMRFRGDKPSLGSKGLWLILLAIGLLVGGVVVMMYYPQIMAFFQSMV